MFSSERGELRKMFFAAWRKHLDKLPIEPLDAQIIDVIIHHPEYHTLMDHPEKNQTADFGVENPFLHMSLHLAIREQISTDRPQGVKQIYLDLFEKYPDGLAVEHGMMECLEKILWDAQRNNMAPDEEKYLGLLRSL